MAKNTQTVASVTTQEGGNHYVESAIAKVRLPWTGDEVDLSTIHPQGVAYLLQYGTNKTGQDAASGLLARAKDLFAKAQDGKASDAERKAYLKLCKECEVSESFIRTLDSDTFARHCVNFVSNERWNDVVSGKMDLPGTRERLTGVDRIIRDMVEAFLGARAKAANTKVTAEQMDALAAAFIARGDEAFLGMKAEAERQWAYQESLKGSADAADDIMSLLNKAA